MRWFLLLFLIAPLWACELKVQVSDFPPYSYQKDGEWQGSRVVLSQRLGQKLNCTVRFLDVPWARALLLMQQGDIDLMFNLTPTPDRQHFIWFNRPHHLERLAFATTLPDPQWQQISTINALSKFPGTIALTQGSFMGAEMQKMLQQPEFRQKTIEVAERRIKNELVLKDRAQGLVEDLDYLQFARANFPEYQQLYITPLRLTQTKVAAGFSKNSVLAIQRQEIEQAIAELDEAGLWFNGSP
ncbi:substrate-binding periplasmic protein [Rheinheimera texasensis]|uniref:substrate-binding periplasmic protein n=1 Tax=Rheinheimera texasensis TaxID=306205 RepID=UPI0004E1C0B8|nr:transporter substrate-binding domain-containing protein [Rheinheimera texasensis]